jgi:glycopeptide antibiotics resistance protein
MRAWLIGLAFGLYLLVLFDLTLVQFRQPGAVRSAVNLVPLAIIASDLRHGGRDFLVNFVGNLAAFMPLGFLMMAASRGRVPVRRVLLAGLFLSALIECLQYRVGGRVSDVDDVLLNTLGSLFGVVAFRGSALLLTLRWPRAVSAVEPARALRFAARSATGEMSRRGAREECGTR